MVVGKRVADAKSSFGEQRILRYSSRIIVCRGSGRVGII